VAITDAEDIKSCKVVRKMAAGEFFEISGELKEDPESKIFRIQGKAQKDGKEGWITVKGNAGTVYAEQTTKYYAVLKEVALQKRFQTAGSEEVRKMEAGEAFQVLEGPKGEKVPPEVRVKVRCLSDKAIGWISKKPDGLKDWSPMYRCLQATPVYDARSGAAVEGSTLLKELTKGETLELLDGPFEDDKVIRMKGRSEKDGVVGWVTIKDAEGKRYLDC
jgi:hypothetical protein